MVDMVLKESKAAYNESGALNSTYKINVRLDMTCWGKTLEELFDAVFEEFNCLWKDIALEGDKKLDESAQKLKQILLILAKEEK
ncbi:MAG: hypothetical protein LBL45_01350 [Treponema sp.]|jgi:hypothetical protein|nr:hypothetical protein [Treponema sp.]